MDERSLKAYIGAVAALSVALVASWIYWFGLEVEPRYLLGVLIFGILLALADAFTLQVGEHSEISALDVGLIAAVVILGPVWAAVAALPCAFVTGKRDPVRVSYEASRNTTEIFLAGIVFSFVSPPLLFSGSQMPAAPVVYATLAAAASLVLANGALDAGLLRAKYNQPLAKTWEEVIAPYLASDAINVLTAGLSVLALLLYGPVAALVLIGGSLGSQAIVLRAREEKRRNDELETEVLSLREALTGAGTIFGSLVMEALGRKDGYTHRHASATAVYAADLARELKLGDARAEQLRTAGLLHNAGLISLPEELLLQTGKLNSVAKNELATHPILGEQALAPIPQFAEMAGWVRWHHERPDGRGYPDKLRGRWIPLEAKILAVSQAYAAMILDQPRRPAMSPSEARKHLVEGMDTQFDSLVTRAFLRILDTETEGYRMADDQRFVLPGLPGSSASPPEADPTNWSGDGVRVTRGEP